MPSQTVPRFSHDDSLILRGSLQYFLRESQSLLGCQQYRTGCDSLRSAGVSINVFNPWFAEAISRLDVSGWAPMRRSAELAILLVLLIVLGPSAYVPHHSTDIIRSNTEESANATLMGTVTKTAYGQPIASAPVIQGWGGVTLSEASTPEMQLTLKRLNESGYNAVRVGFSGTETACSSGELGVWNPSWFSQTLQLAQNYNMWVVLDYHSYNDTVNSICQASWLTFWKGILSSSWGYGRIVWEPINEPAGSVSVLSLAYQAWITQARALGDTHWIAIENTVSNDGCNFDPSSLTNCYPMVTDTINRTFLSIHPYFFYNEWQARGYGTCGPPRIWNSDTAECVAEIYNQGMIQAGQAYHMPILDTEGGAVYYSCNNVCASPPDAIGTDDASYSNTTFHFIQYLTNRMQSEGMGWIWWEAGEGACCGALDTWGKMLRFHQATQPPQTNMPPGSSPPASPIVWLLVVSVAATSMIAAFTLYKKRVKKRGKPKSPLSS